MNDGEPVARVAESIKRFGWGAVILARSDGAEVVAGHTRYKAVDLLQRQWQTAPESDRAGWHPEAVRSATHDEVPVRFGGWNEQEAHALAVADNRLNEFATWDLPRLADVLKDYVPSEFVAMGFTEKDLAKLTSQLDPDAQDTAQSPAEFPDASDVKTEHECPKCGYCW